EAEASSVERQLPRRATCSGELAEPLAARPRGADDGGSASGCEDRACDLLEREQQVLHDVAHETGPARRPDHLLPKLEAVAARRHPRRRSLLDVRTLDAG